MQENIGVEHKWGVYLGVSLANNISLALEVIKQAKPTTFDSFSPGLFMFIAGEIGGETEEGYKWCCAEFIKILRETAFSDKYKDDLYHVMLKCTKKMGDFEKEKEFLEIEHPFVYFGSTQYGRPPFELYAAVLVGHAKRGEVDKAITIKNRIMKGYGHLNDKIYSALIQMYAVKGNAEEAQKWVRERKGQGFPANYRTYESLVLAFSTKGDMETALKVKEEMDTNKAINSRPGMYDILIDGYIKKGEMENALKIKQDKEAAGFLRANTYNLLIRAYALKGEMKQAYRLKAEMVKKGLKPSDITNGLLVAGFAKNGMLEEACIVKDELEEQGMKTSSFAYQSLIDGFVKSGDFDSALKTMTDMEAKGVVPDAAIFLSMINGFIEKGKPHNAVKMIGLMEKRMVVPGEILLTILQGVAQVGDEHTANLIIARIREIHTNSSDLADGISNSLVDLYSKRGELDRAAALPFSRLDEQHQTNLVKALIKEGKIETATSLVTKCNDNFFGPLAPILIDAYTKIGDLEKVEQLHNRLIKIKPFKIPGY